MSHSLVPIGFQKRSKISKRSDTGKVGKLDDAQILRLSLCLICKFFINKLKIVHYFWWKLHVSNGKILEEVMFTQVKLLHGRNPSDNEFKLNDEVK